MASKILIGDSLSVLKTLPAESVDCCMTSPPYFGLRDYGTAKWEGGNVDCDHKAAKQKSRYDYSMATSPNQAQNKGTDAPRYKDVCPDCGAIKVDHQLGLEKTPQEYIDNLCDIFDEVKRVLKPEGSCWVNLGDSYAGAGNGSFNAKESQLGKQTRKSAYLCDGKGKSNTGLQPKSLIQIPARFSIEMANRGWILRNTIIWYKGRVMPSSATDRFTIDYEPLFFFTKSTKYYFKQQLEPLAASTKKRIEYPWVEGDNKLTIGGGQHAGLDGKSFNGMMERMKSSKGRNMRCVWKVKHGGDFKGKHFATYPPTLCETPIAAGCPVNGIVLDPFSGAGTTGLVAIKQKKQYIGIELNPEYADISERRLMIGKHEGKHII